MENQSPFDLSLAGEPRVLSGAEISAALEQLGWKQSDLARRVGSAPNTISRWVVGEREAPLWLSEYLQTMLALRQLAIRFGVAR